MIQNKSQMRIVDEIYQFVQRAVTDEIELPDNWMNSRMEDCVDARYILVNLLFSNGLSRKQIESKTGLPKATVRLYVNTYSERIKTRKMMAMWSAAIGQKIGNKT